VLGLVGQHRRAGDIADRIDAGHIGLAVAVDDDEAAVGLDAERFQPEIFDIAD
jgi:hypothetical protein